MYAANLAALISQQISRVYVMIIVEVSEYLIYII
jgi:hypothetical protein